MSLKLSPKLLALVAQLPPDQVPERDYMAKTACARCSVAAFHATPIETGGVHISLVGCGHNLSVNTESMPCNCTHETVDTSKSPISSFARLVRSVAAGGADVAVKPIPIARPRT